MDYTNLLLLDELRKYVAKHISKVEKNHIFKDDINEFLAEITSASAVVILKKIFTGDSSSEILKFIIFE